MCTPEINQDQAAYQELDGWLKEELKKELDRIQSEAVSYFVHEFLWGVPCRPTLAMVSLNDHIIDIEEYFLRRTDNG